MDNFHSGTRNKALSNFSQSMLLNQQKLKQKIKIRNEKQMRIEQARNNRNSLAKMNTKHRYESFAQSGQQDNELIRSLVEGAIPLKHPDLHLFRDRNKNQEKEQYGGVRVKTFMLSKERANLMESIFKEKHLERDEFSQRLPHKDYNYWLRERELAHEAVEMRYGKNARTENQNIQDSINSINYIDHAPRKMKMVNFPDWKPANKQKWLNDKDFARFSCLYNGQRNIDPWKTIPVNSGIFDPYIDGFDALGEKMARKREKSQEKSRPEFISQIKKDLWEDTLKTSKSIRTHKQDIAFKKGDNQDMFSQQQTLNFYKQTLISTKSVDRIAPFKHSNNLYGLDMNNLRPVNQKIYRNSLKQNEIQFTPSQLSFNNNYNSSTKAESMIKINIKKENQDEIDNGKAQASLHNLDDKDTSVVNGKNQSHIQFNTLTSIQSIPEKQKLPHFQSKNSLKNSSIIEKKQYLPWEQPSKDEVSSIISQYFSKQNTINKKKKLNSSLSGHQQQQQQVSQQQIEIKE